MKIHLPADLDAPQLAASGLEVVASLVRRLATTQAGSLVAASTLHTLERSGPCRLSELAARSGITQPAMTQLVSRLEWGGYADRRACADDGRVVMVHLAPAGAALLNRRREARAARLAELTGRLPTADRAAIAMALPALDRLTALYDTDEGVPEV